MSQHWLRRHRQLLLNCGVGGVLCAFSDAVAQQIENQERCEREDTLFPIGRDAANAASDALSSPATYRCFGVPSQACSSSSAPDVSHWTLENRAGNDGRTMNEISHLPLTWDYRRVLVAAGVGALVGGFVYPFAYAQLDKVFSAALSMKVILQKSVVEIGTVGIFVNSVSMTTRGLFQPPTCRPRSLASRPSTLQDSKEHFRGGTITDCVSTDDLSVKGHAESRHIRLSQRIVVVLGHVCREMPTVTYHDFGVWLPYNILAFSCIPLVVRPITTSFMEAAWQTYISYKSHNQTNRTDT
jgi:Mpv17 / PMP22 family